MGQIRIWNPYKKGVSHLAKYHHHRRHSHRRRNPLGFDKSTLTGAAFGVAGAVGSLALPAMVLPSQNTGAVGYLLNAGAAFAMKVAGDMLLGKSAGDELFAGGLVGVGLRIIKDNFAGIPGLSAYWSSYLPNFPAASNPYGQMANPMPAALPAAAGSGKAMAGSFSHRYGRGGRF